MTDKSKGNHAYNEFMRHVEMYEHDKILNQIDKTRPFTFGAEINVMLITDRLFGCAEGLRAYLRNSVDVIVDIVHSVEEARVTMPYRLRYDFLIIVGFLGIEQNYDIINEMKKIHKDVITIMYARLGKVIQDECKLYEIEHAFSSDDPVDSFIAHMRALHIAR